MKSCWERYALAIMARCGLEEKSLEQKYLGCSLIQKKALLDRDYYYNNDNNNNNNNILF